MTPILYESNESKFESNGIGRLIDASSCVVTEDRNGQYELEMHYPVSGRLFPELKTGRIILAVPSYEMESQPFVIYKISKSIADQVTVYAYHISYLLLRMPVEPFSADNCQAAMAGLSQHCVVDCPFTFGTDKTATAKFAVKYPKSIRSLLAGEEGSILDAYGTGEYLFDRFSVSLKLHRGADYGFQLRYGKNITDLSNVDDFSEVITGVYPYYNNGMDALIELPEKVLKSDDYDKYPYGKVVTFDTSEYFSDVIPTEDQLRTRGQQYLKDYGGWHLKTSIEVSFVDLKGNDNVHLCDTVTVIYGDAGIRISTKVISTRWDVLRDRYESITLGDVATTLEDAIIGSGAEAIKQASRDYTAAAVSSATRQITGNKGGYVAIVDTDGDKKPDEILVMDNLDKDKASKVWRWNKSGLGFSGSGYNGTYGLALTADGAIVADKITSGTLNANVIRAGIITDATGKTTWNLDEATFVAKDAELYGSLNADGIIIKDGKLSIGSGAWSAVLSMGTYVNAAGNSYYCISVNRMFYSSDTINAALGFGVGQYPGVTGSVTLVKGTTGASSTVTVPTGTLSSKTVVVGTKAGSGVVSSLHYRKVTVVTAVNFTSKTVTTDSVYVLGNNKYDSSPVSSVALDTATIYAMDSSSTDRVNRASSDSTVSLSVKGGLIIGGV